MIAECAEERQVFFYPHEQEEKVQPVGNTTLELYIDVSAMVFQAILERISLPEMSDRELIEATEKAGTFQFWNTPADDIYNDLLNE